MEWVKGQAIWKQIEMILLEEIVSGAYKPGEKLPTENELARRFSVNRHTVRNAIAALCKADITKVEQGRGIYVKERILSYPLSQRTRFSQIVSGKHRMPDKHLIGYSIAAASSHIAESLKLPSGTDLICIESLSIADTIPIGHCLNYLEHARFPGIAEVFKAAKSLTTTLQHFGVPDYTRKHTRLVAKMPSEKVAQHLRQPKSKPVLQSESLDITPDGRPLEVGITCFSGDRIELIVDGLQT